jgi:hypothetical protein
LPGLPFGDLRYKLLELREETIRIADLRREVTAG